ncbi:general secretion pathway protein GspK [Planctomycetes bacterium Pla163]
MQSPTGSIGRTAHGLGHDHGTRRAQGEARRGVALIVVLLALMALFALCAPFLWLASSVDDASSRLVDRTRTQLALDDAAVHARLVLAGTHPSLDPDRDFDSLDELSGTWPLDELLYDSLDEQGVMWDHAVEDLAGRIDLASCPPSVLANLLGLSGYLTQPLASDDEELRLSGGDRFPEAGYLYVGGEFIAYDTRRGGTFTDLTRALFYNEDEGGCGPRPASTHGAGTPVFGMEAMVFAQWRQTRGMRAARAMGFGELGEELRRLLPEQRTPLSAQNEVATPELAYDPLREMAIVLDRTATLYGDVAASRRWQSPVRVENLLVGRASCRLRVSDARWFSPGSTVRIVGADGNEELGIVRGFVRGGFIVLEEPVRNDYAPRQAQVQVLSRRPVNVNTASRDVLVALFENLALLGRNDRVTRGEAERLSDTIIEQRPFEGFEDFLERLLLPAGGIVKAEPGQSNEQARQGAAADIAPFLDLNDVIAIYKNARNANDSDLSFSTMPLAFTSRDVFSIDLRASLNVQGLKERFSVAREQIEFVAPPGELLHAWASQSDFEEELRLDRAAPGWLSGPAAVSVPDLRFGGSPPPRSISQLAISIDAESGEAPVSRSIFPSDEPDGFVRPWTERADEAGPRQGRVVHFDRSRGDLEGHDLGQQVLDYAPETGQVGWADGNGVFQPSGLSLWVKPTDTTSGHLFDSGTGSPDNDRYRAFFENGELIVEVLDAVGDHPDTEFEERARLRLPLAGSPLVPGLWSHLEVDMHSNRPDGISLRLDGMGFGRPQSATSVAVRGRTFLTGAIGSDDTTIPVESTEDFPDTCTLLIGNEVVEAVKSGPNSFEAVHQLNGELAGYGGRLARELFEYRSAQGALELVNRSIVTKPGTYPVGTQVQLWGYSSLLSSEIPPGGGVLDGDIGPFSVARVVGVDGTRGEEISFTVRGGGVAGPFEIPIGLGFDAGETPPETLELAACDSNQTASEAMRGFSRSGGYALVMQRLTSFVVPPTGGNPGETVDGPQTPFGTPLFGLQVIRYGGVRATSLTGLDWSVDANSIPSLEGTYPIIGEVGVPRAYLIEYGGRLADPDAFNESLAAQIVVVPISLPCGANQIDFLEAEPLYGANFDPTDVVNGEETARFAQLTRTDRAENTEWFRYDFILNGEFVRAAPSAFISLYTALTRGQDFDGEVSTPGGSGGGGGVPGGGASGGASGGVPGGFGFVEDDASQLPVVGASTARTPASASLPEPLVGPFTATVPGAPPLSYWDPRIGEDELEDLPFTSAMSDALQFRGVLDTFSHAHPDGTDVLPVVRVADPRLQSTDRGWMGRGDPVFLVSDLPGDPGQAVVVHRAWRPITFQYDNVGDFPTQLTTSWQAEPGLLATDLGDRLTPIYGIENWTQVQLVAFDRQVGLPYLPDANPLAYGDMRERNRITKFPSGEAPRLAAGLSIGASLDGGERLDAVVDEIEFHTGQFAPFRTPPLGFDLILAAEIDDEQTTLAVQNGMRSAWGIVGFGNQSVLDRLPEDGGLLRIGREILAYQSYDTTTNEFQLAENGRGLLGTDASAHAEWESVVFLSHVSVSTLTANLRVDDEFLQLDGSGGGNRTGADDFGDVGTVLVGDELVGYTYKDGNVLGMPRTSSQPGRNDFQGQPAFRGRFGTLPDEHPAGTAVIRFPVRYADRFSARADLPELAHLTLQLSQPDAFLTGIFFEQDAVPDGSVRLGVLQRTDESVPWDADPNDEPALEVFYEADPSQGPIAQGRQIDRAEWRVFVEYMSGAFDPVEGLATGWKQTPSLLMFGALYFAPGRVIARRER